MERQAGGGQRACPHRRRARAERPVFLPCPPAWDGPGCWVGTGVRARERERKNTETALVEGQTDRPAYRPRPQPSAVPTPSLARPSEAKNKNVEKSLYRLPGGKTGAGTRALPGALSPRINLHPKSMAQRQDLQPGPPPPRRWCSEGWQLRQAEAAVDAGVVRARVGQAQGLQEGPAGGLALEGQLGLQVGDGQRWAEATETRGEGDEAAVDAGRPPGLGGGAPVRAPERFPQRVSCQPAPTRSLPTSAARGGPGWGRGPSPGCAPPRPHLPERGTGGGDGREGPAGSSAGWGPAQTLTRGPTAAGGAGRQGSMRRAGVDVRGRD